MTVEDRRSVSTADLLTEQRRDVDDDAVAQTSVAEDKPVALFAGDECDDMRHRWNDVQTGFVDDPRVR